MTRRAVLICPGRGTYNKAELGYLTRHHADKTDMMSAFDAIRTEQGQPALAELDGAARFSIATHTRGDIASPLIYACSLADARSLADDIEVVAVTGNSMGWYIALAAAAALSAEDGFRVVNTMGRLMQEALIGGQVVYPFLDEDWRPETSRKGELLTLVAEIDARADHALALSIDLGGMLVLGGNEAGLAAFESSVPPAQERFPMILSNHAAFHTHLQRPVAERGRGSLPATLFRQPQVPLIDGRGGIWRPHSSDTEALWDYTLGHQVTEPYDFTRAVQVAAREFAPNLFIVTGPGATLGGAVAQSLVLADWQGLGSKRNFQEHQNEVPLLVSMGRDDQRGLVS